MVRARIPELGERVQMGKYATGFPGVWGQVIKIDDNPPVGILRATGGASHVEVYILAELPLYRGKRVVIKASPYELDGGLLDERPVFEGRKP